MDLEKNTADLMDDGHWGPVDPEEEAADSSGDFQYVPERRLPEGEPEKPKLPGHEREPELPEHPQAPELPEQATSLNEELSEKIKDDPNKFLGCGG